MEAQFVKLAGAAVIQLSKLAEALNMPVPSIRGQHFLCCIRGEIGAILSHTEYKVTAVDPLAALGENVLI